MPDAHTSGQRTDPAAYGSAFADVYDRWYGDDPDDELAAIATATPPGGRILELGAGTGRIAVPLAEAGFDVWALDGSPAMLARLATRDTGELVHATCADLTDVPEGPFDTVVCTRNTLFNLTRPGDQRRCLRAVARALAPAGSLLIEGQVLDPDAPRHGRAIEQRGGESVTVAWTADPFRRLVAGSFETGHGATRTVRRWSLRVTAPSELDRWAASAGMRLAARWSDWRGGDDRGGPTQVSRYTRT